MTTFSEFVQTRGATLWRTAWLLTGDRALAEDLLQTALVKAWPHYERVSSNGSFEAYVQTALATTYTSWRRRRWWAETPTELTEEVGRAGGPEDDVELSQDVRRALGDLSPQQRAVVVLRYYCDLTEAETARSLGCSVGTVKTHHARALGRLRDSNLLTEQTDRTEEPR